MMLPVEVRGVEKTGGLRVFRLVLIAHHLTTLSSARDQGLSLLASVHPSRFLSSDLIMIKREKER